MTRTLTRQTVSALLGMVLIGAGSACAVNPATGQRQLSLISEAQEVQLGREAAQDVQASLGLLDGDQLQAYVQRVGKRLAAGSERPNLPWSFKVVDDPTPNAFALPGGFIYVTRGLLALLTSEAELATVLGHEIGHVTARHSVNQISKAQLAELGFGLGGILFPETQQLAPAIGAGLQLLFLKYGRDDERQADEVGYRYLRDGGYSKRRHAFMGLLTCARCGCTMTAERKKGKYVYYRCTGFKGRCGNTYIREEALSKLLGGTVQAAQLPPDVAESLAVPSGCRRAGRP